MIRPNLIYDPLAGGDVTANLQVAADGLYIFDNNGKCLQHWQYAEIVHAFDGRHGNHDTLIQRDRPEIRLTVAEGAMYDRISELAPQLRQRPLLSWRLAWDSVPEESKLVVIIALFGFPTLGLYLLIRLFD